MDACGLSVHAQHMCGVQRIICKSRFLPPSCGSQESNSGCQPLPQTRLPTKPPCWLRLSRFNSNGKLASTRPREVDRMCLSYVICHSGAMRNLETHPGNRVGVDGDLAKRVGGR